MAAIVRTESGFKPLAIRVNGGARLERQPANINEAVSTAKWLIQNGYNIDMGLGQVNSTNLAKTGLSVEAAFDPCKNLAAAAMILQGNYQSAIRQTPHEQSALHAALSAYNTGSFSKGFSNGYVQKVVNNAGVGVVAPIPLAKAAKAAKPDTANHIQAKVQKSAGTEKDSILTVPSGEGSQPTGNKEGPDQSVMIYR
jgi:type IV secretion system protein VirB1